MDLNGQVMTRRLLRMMRGVRSTRGRMVGLGEREVRCSGGEALPADLVVCATGFRIPVPPLYIEEAEADDLQSSSSSSGRRRRCDVESEQPLLFRSMVLPQTPKISAILYNSMGINAMFSSELMAAWLARFYASGRADNFRGAREVEPDAAPLQALGRGEPFNTWHFDRSGEKAGGRGYASDYYEEQIYADLGMKLPSRDLALTRSQHDERCYVQAAARFEAIAQERKGV